MLAAMVQKLTHLSQKKERFLLPTSNHLPAGNTQVPAVTKMRKIIDLK